MLPLVFPRVQKNYGSSCDRRDGLGKEAESGAAKQADFGNRLLILDIV